MIVKQAASHSLDGLSGAGAPEVIVTTYADLAAAIRTTVDDIFSDPFVYGPKLRETGVDRLVVRTIERVSQSCRSKGAV
jgi:hypothetical protein